MVRHLAALVPLEPIVLEELCAKIVQQGRIVRPLERAMYQAARPVLLETTALSDLSPQHHVILEPIVRLLVPRIPLHASSVQLRTTVLQRAWYRPHCALGGTFVLTRGCQIHWPAGWEHIAPLDHSPPHPFHAGLEHMLLDIITVLVQTVRRVCWLSLVLILHIEMASTRRVAYALTTFIVRAAPQ